MTAYPKAALLAELAEVAKTDEKPWEEFEYCSRAGWFTCGCLAEVLRADCPVRRKPRTIKINGYDVPEPLREAPANNTSVWIVDVSAMEPWLGSYTNDPVYKYTHWLDAGLLHLTEKAAQTHIDALLSFTRRDEE